MLLMRETGLAERYRQVRNFTEELCRPLANEDYVVQSMPDCSPAKWHLAHVTWFFETFIVIPNLPGYEPIDPRYGYLFNSYYEAVGNRHPRPKRGLLTRPTVDEVYEYRAHVDGAMAELLDRRSDAVDRLATLGLHHEQQHQELLLTDLKHLLSWNVLHPVYSPQATAADRSPGPLGWLAEAGGAVETGYAGDDFCFDNEQPRHVQHLLPYELAS
ncbi:MAG: DinB family protein, partial [Chloroflexi bacterium]|nr:DinB family protein [Chloroflexota bacterium]